MDSKRFGQDQPVQTAHADLGQYFMYMHLAPFHRKVFIEM